MQRTLTLAAFAALCTLALTCKKEPPVVPPNGRPDTTSHEFAWSLDTVASGSSFIRDVAVISANDIWIVGEIFPRRSGNLFSDTMHNVARWDGIQWTYQRLTFPQYNVDCSIAFHGGPSIKAVFAFGLSNVLVTDGGSIALWNGSTFVHYPCLPRVLRSGPVMRIWGRSESDFFVAGENGTLIRFDNGTWRRLESGTTLNVVDIWGARNQSTGEWEVLAVASRSFAGPERAILHIPIGGGSVTVMSDSGITRALEGVWFAPGNSYYTVGDGIYRKASVLATERWTSLHGGLTQLYSNAIRGNAPNDVTIVGAFGDVLHFNGSTWRQYSELHMNGSLYRLSVAGNIVAATGFQDNYTVVLRGIRNQ